MKDTWEKVDLLPCPCGSRVGEVIAWLEDKEFAVMCTVCRRIGPRDPDRLEAARLWNKRRENDGHEVSS
jgi:hypothetical protein